MSDELKPCPLCGGEVRIHRSTDGQVDGIVCDECLLTLEAVNILPEWHTLDELVQRWSARAAVTDEQFARAIHDGAVWQVVRECRFALEEDRDMLAEKAACGPGEFVTQDMPDLLWTCSACGEQYRNGLDALPGWLKHCPNCGAKVVG